MWYEANSDQTKGSVMSGISLYYLPTPQVGSLSQNVTCSPLHSLLHNTPCELTLTLLGLQVPDLTHIAVYNLFNT